MEFFFEDSSSLDGSDLDKLLNDDDEIENFSLMLALKDIEEKNRKMGGCPNRSSLCASEPRS